jgi:hypothetical protein
VTSADWGAFSAAINWKEPLIRGLLAFHLFLYMLFIGFLLFGNVAGQAALFFFIALLVAFSERINTYFAEHWEDVATQNYFDGQGVFAGILFAAPLLTLCLFQLVSGRS